MQFRWSFGLWMAFLGIAMANGAVGDLLLARFISPYGIHLYKTGVAVLALIILARLYAQKVRPTRWLQDALECSFIWVILTLSFEFLVGHYLLNNPWAVIIQEYHLAEGRWWVLVPTTEFIAPLFLGWRRRPKFR